jgi:hypothetical protein
MSEQLSGEQHRSGDWLGQLEGISVREPGPDADGAIVELHGSEDMAAAEIENERFVDKLSDLAAEVQLILDGVDDVG